MYNSIQATPPTPRQPKHQFRRHSNRWCWWASLLWWYDGQMDPFPGFRVGCVHVHLVWISRRCLLPMALYRFRSHHWNRHSRSTSSRRGTQSCPRGRTPRVVFATTAGAVRIVWGVPSNSRHQGLAPPLGTNSTVPRRPCIRLVVLAGAAISSSGVDRFRVECSENGTITPIESFWAVTLMICLFDTIVNSRMPWYNNQFAIADGVSEFRSSGMPWKRKQTVTGGKCSGLKRDAGALLCFNEALRLLVLTT